MSEVETADQLRAKLVAARARRAQEIQRTQELLREVEEAKERSNLRAQLEAIECETAKQRSINLYHSKFKDSLDADSAFPWEHQEDHPLGTSTAGGIGGTGSSDITTFKAGSTSCCNKHIRKGSFEWKIQGMSWLVSSLAFDQDAFAYSESYELGHFHFDMVYHPKRGVLCKDGNPEQMRWGSLAMRKHGDKGIMLRYKFFIKTASDEWVQWGDAGNVCESNYKKSQCNVFGPDVQASAPLNPVGIFGLKHSDLIESEWVQNDILHVKVDLEIKAQDSLGWEINEASCEEVGDASTEVPPGSLDADMLSLLNSGDRGDVVFIVEGEQIKGHASILSVRARVFATLLDCGMSESLSKEIVIEDCSAAVFKAFLKFLYTDNLEAVAEQLKINSASGETEDSCKVLLNLLSVSHKYQVGRLQCWCEQRLKSFMSVRAVCDILCQAHLHEAKSLQRCCLAFIKDHFQKIASTAEFGNLAATWPEVMIKINVYMGGLPEEGGADALHEARRKRQKLGSDV